MQTCVGGVKAGAERVGDQGVTPDAARDRRAAVNLWQRTASFTRFIATRAAMGGLLRAVTEKTYTFPRVVE